MYGSCERAQVIPQEQEISGPQQGDVVPDKTLYTVRFSDTLLVDGIAGMLNQTIAFEIGQGLRPLTHGKECDVFDGFQRDFMLGSTRKQTVSVPLSEARIEKLRTKVTAYIVSKGLSVEEGEELIVPIDEMRKGLTDARGGKNTEMINPNPFAVNPRTFFEGKAESKKEKV